MTYLGWSNRATWRVNAMVQTDERLHVARRAMLDSMSRPLTADDVRRFYWRTMRGTEPDSATTRDEADKLLAIDFEQLAAEWERIRTFRLGLLGRKG